MRALVLTLSSVLCVEVAQAVTREYQTSGALDQVKASRIPDGKAPTSRAARVALLMSANPQSTRELCDACVAAEDHLIANQTALVSAQAELVTAQSESSSATTTHDTCSTEEATLSTETATNKGHVTSRLTSVNIAVTDDDAAGALMAAGTSEDSTLKQLIQSWADKKTELTAKTAECATKLASKTTKEGVVAAKTATVTTATANVATATSGAETACATMRGAGYGAPTAAPTELATTAQAGGLGAASGGDDVGGDDTGLFPP